MNVAVGVSDHIGWAELVTVRRNAGEFEFLARRHVVLIDQGIPSAPYHHEGLVLPVPAVAPLVAAARAAITERCLKELRAQVSEFGIEAVVIQESPHPSLPSLELILASYQLTCAADGMMYRETIAQCATELGLQVLRYPRKSDRWAAAAEALKIPKAKMVSLLKEFGDQAGAPWRKEHQQAAASALAILGKL